MFSIGQKIIYGSDGVFTVEEYSSSPIDKNDKRQFYVLRPVHGPSGNLIYTPVDNDKVMMRAIMTRQEALFFIEKIPDIEPVSVEKEKNRSESYRKAMQRAQGEDYVSIIKAVHQRRENCIRLKKRLSESDTEYEKKAKICLYGEISSSLGIPFNEVESFIVSKLDK